MSEKYELGNAIAQVKKYKRRMDKAKEAKKMIYRALLAFWKEIRDALQEDTQNPQANDDDTEAPADTLEDPLDHSSNPESHPESDPETDPQSGPESEPEQQSAESDEDAEGSVICDPTEPSEGREDVPPTYA